MKIRFQICALVSCLLLVLTLQELKSQTITFSSLLDEMTDLQRLTTLPESNYKSIQFSSYDRRSKSPESPGWFSNEDGFGEEPIPGFEKVLKIPDTSGVGEYLICDVQHPGAILRLWTADITGKIRLYLDNMNAPFYEGDAREFFWNTISALAGKGEKQDTSYNFRQYDAVYFPIPFAGRCRIEWIGDIKKTHFYHVGIRVYDSSVKVESFRKNDIEKYNQKLAEISNLLNSQIRTSEYGSTGLVSRNTGILADSTAILLHEYGQGAIDYFSIKLRVNQSENILRKNILSIYFDDSPVPQVMAPVGDFFGMAPGINSYLSYPMEVKNDGTMICRFMMPFRRSMRIEIQNHSLENVEYSATIHRTSYTWQEGKSLYFHARWRMTNEITASNVKISDIPYLLAFGKGRVVGAAAYIYNPSNVPTSWGNWWGEGDEKIYVDQDSFPSFFGTGSEDYFNYSWSSAKIFSYPYCGQPRNDGPGNRGYISNFRWHIFDDILFNDKLAFYMELLHHGDVPHFSYGRIVYFYALPNLHDDHQQISMDELRNVTYLPWKPLAYLGSRGFRFLQAEDLIINESSVQVEKGNLGSAGAILFWTPGKKGSRLKMQFDCSHELLNTNIVFTMCHLPSGGRISVSVNGTPTKIDGKEILDLAEKNQKVLDNHFTGLLNLRKGNNEIVFESEENLTGKKIGIDFIWLKEETK